MRVNCYNACSLPIESVPVGDTFYYEDVLYLKVCLDVPQYSSGEPYRAVDLARGIVVTFPDGSLTVTKADATVVCE